MNPALLTIAASTALISSSSLCDDHWGPSFDSHRNSNIPLNRNNFIADAAELVLAPSVVNIVCEVHKVFQHGVSTGSGFIVSKDGFIVTNAHVVSHSSDGNVLVTMSNMRERRGVIHSLDKKTD